MPNLDSRRNKPCSTFTDYSNFQDPFVSVQQILEMLRNSLPVFYVDMQFRFLNSFLARLTKVLICQILSPLCSLQSAVSWFQELYNQSPSPSNDFALHRAFWKLTGSRRFLFDRRPSNLLSLFEDALPKPLSTLLLFLH